jgi:hypothetical protein
MTDPERFLDHPPSELGALLLRAGSEEGPSHRSLQRTLSALGVGVTALGAATSASALGTAGTAATAGLGAGAAAAAVGTKWAGSLGVVVLAKWGGVGVASGIAVALAVHGGTAAVQRAPVAALSTAPAVVTSVPSAVVVSARAPHATETEQAAPEPPAAVASEAKSSAIAAEEEAAPLAAEVAFVDRGRAAYQHGDALGAERALSGYEAEFAEPRLLPEVLYLRMEIATQRGERARAVALAERILRQHARSPHAARARLVLREE